MLTSNDHQEARGQFLEPGVSAGHKKQGSKLPGFGSFLSQGAAAGTVGGFLFPVSQIAATHNPYDALYLFVLPFFLVGGVLLGVIESLIIWACTKLLGRRLSVIARSAIAMLAIGIPIAFCWWWFPSTPTPSVYSPDSSPNAVASLRGIQAVKLYVGFSSSNARPEDITEDQLKNLVTHKLLDAGIEVVDIDRNDQPQIVLCINYSFWNRWDENSTHSTFRVRLRQPVLLSRDSNIPTEATTWEHYGESMSAGSPVHSQIQEAVERFVQDCQLANSDYVAPDYGAPARSRVRWHFIGLGLVILLIGTVSGSQLQPWRILAYGLAKERWEISGLAIVAGIVLRSLIVFCLMESILVLILTLHSEYETREFWRAHAFAAILFAHCLLSLVIALGRLKFAILLNLALLANLVVVLCCWFDLNSNRTQLFIVEYSVLWAIFILTRFTIFQSGLSYLKQEFRYYLID